MSSKIQTRPTRFMRNLTSSGPRTMVHSKGKLDGGGLTLTEKQKRFEASLHKPVTKRGLLSDALHKPSEASEEAKKKNWEKIKIGLEKQKKYYSQFSKEDHKKMAEKFKKVMANKKNK